MLLYNLVGLEKIPIIRVPEPGFYSHERHS